MLYAQADSILAENIFRYELKDGRATRNRMIIQQNTYDLNQKLIRRIYYDSVANIAQSTLIFYRDNVPVSEETFNKDFQIDSVRRFAYTAEGKRDKEILYSIHDGVPQKKSSIQYEYDNHRLKQETLYNEKDKWIRKTTFAEEQGKQTTSSVYRKGTHSQGVRERITETIFEEGKPSVMKITENLFSKVSRIRTILFEYDSLTQQLQSEKWMDEANSLLKEVLYRYYPEGYIRSRSIRISSGDYIEHLVYERSKHNIILGNPEMLFIPEEDQ